ncbi:beta-1,3-galactosyltransferase 1-like isoform X2 [Penaeus chinensis]|nr:beta-1,3-galactosyltransferase 1-like isoform X2 [Penaeus chinensis]
MIRHIVTVRLAPSTRLKRPNSPAAKSLPSMCDRLPAMISLRMLLVLATPIFLVLIALNLSPPSPSLPFPPHPVSESERRDLKKEEGKGQDLSGRSQEVRWTRGERPWRQVVASWDKKFKVPSRAEGPVLNPYPDQVTFLVNEEKACKDTPLALALVVTAPSNAKKRHFIRNTWGHPALVEVTGIRPIFIVGQTADPAAQASLSHETSQYHDVIQANFRDSYQNLTYKTTALLTWASTYCPSTPIVLKIDDDVIPNPIALQKWLINFLESNPHPSEILGKERCCDPVLRSGKWGVSNEDYPGNSYPPYVAGPSYMVPMPVVSALLHAVRRTQFLFLEDVYTTGLAAKKGSISHYNIFTLTNSLPNKIDVLWCSGARVFQENVGLKEATRGWNKIRELEGITEPPEYIFTP